MIRRNILANTVGRIWGFVSAYLFVPLYINFLGMEAYGLVGFYSTLLGVLAFADIGLTASLNREMARLSVRSDSSGSMRDLLRTYETTYLGISSLVAVLVWVLAPLLAQHWLGSRVLPASEMTAALRWMGIAIALQLPAGLYIGGLMGLQKQVRANSLQMAWGLLRGLGAVLILWLWSPTISAFAIWQLVSNAFYCLAARRALWRAQPEYPSLPGTHSRPDALLKTRGYAVSMAAMAGVSILLTQTDKLAVSKMLPLEMLGYYSLAGVLASTPTTLAGPIALAVFPRLTGLVSLKQVGSLALLYHRTCTLISLAVIPASLTLMFFAQDLIFAWSGNPVTAERAGLAASLLLGGQLLQAISMAPYYLGLAHGDAKLNLQVGIISLVLITPVLIYLTGKYGIVGAGMSWLAVNLGMIAPYMWLLHRRFLRGEFHQWALFDVGRPLLAALPSVVLFRWLIAPQPSRLLTVAVIVLTWAVSAAITAAVIPEARNLWRQRPKAVPCTA